MLLVPCALPSFLFSYLLFMPDGAPPSPTLPTALLPAVRRLLCAAAAAWHVQLPAPAGRLWGTSTPAVPASPRLACSLNAAAKLRPLEHLDGP